MSNESDKPSSSTPSSTPSSMSHVYLCPDCLKTYLTPRTRKKCSECNGAVQKIGWIETIKQPVNQSTES